MSSKPLGKVMGNDKDVKDPGKQIVDLLLKLDSMPEYKLLLRIKSLEASLYVFRRNYKELKNLLTKHSELTEAIRLRGVGKKPEMRGLLYEIARLLHNFLSSVKSLIEHTRNIYREIYGEAGDFPEYQVEIDKRFANNPLAQFVEGLRNYCLHYELPVGSSVLEFSKLPPTPIFESRIELKIEELNQYSKWSALAKEYISHQGKSINLMNVVDEYYVMVEDFYNYFQTRQREIHSQELAKLASIQQELEDLTKKT